MPVSAFTRFALTGSVVAVAAVGLIGFTSLGFGAVLAGETRQTQPGPEAAAAIGAMKAVSPPGADPVPEG